MFAKWLKTFTGFKTITEASKIADASIGPATTKTNIIKATTTTTGQTNMNVILNNGLKMPRIGLGTYNIKDKATCLKVFDEAITAGYRLFDTGTLYGNDQYIGDVVYNRLNSKDLKRDEIFIETKIAPWEHGKSNTNLSVKDSLKRLKLSYIDLVLVHWPGVAKAKPNDPNNKSMRKETWQELESLVSAGKIRSIGVSNYTVKHLEDLLSYCSLKPVVNQVEFHPLCYQMDLLNFCKKNDIYLQAYSSLGSSQSNPPGWTVLFNNDIVKSIAASHSKTIPQILLRWSLQHDCLLIPKTSKVENLKPNIEIFDFELSADDVAKLDSLNSNKHFCWNPQEID